MTTDAAASAPPKKRKGRSPSYPGIPLDEALERARVLYSRDRLAAIAVDTVLDHWGYKPKSGAGLVALAALLKFGLLVDEGSGAARRARLSEDARRIILDEREDSSERDELIRTAALRPTIHRQLWERYNGALPSDANLRHYLLIEKSFTESGVSDFIREFRRTVDFARLSESDSLTPDAADKTPEAKQQIKPPAPPGMGQQMDDGATQTLVLPISGTDQWPMLVVPKRMTEAAWNQMVTVLEAMKPGILAASDAKPSPSPNLMEDLIDDGDNERE